VKSCYQFLRDAVLSLRRRAEGRRKCVRAAVIASLAACGAATAQIASPEQRNFVACPEVMDTQDAPCWIAEYKGERYFLVVQTGRGGGGTIKPPELRHKALIEGTVSDEPRICGGIVLRPVMISTLSYEMDNSCNQVLPAGGYHTTSVRAIGLDGDPPAPRVARTVNARFGAARGLEERRALYAANAAARRAMTFTIHYTFDSTYLMYPDEQEKVEDAVDYAQQLHASRVNVVGYRGQTLLSGGGRLTERGNLAEKRTKEIAGILANFGWPVDKLSARWVETPQNNGGTHDYERRRLEIVVEP
jgi:outer membrane protein OmpA-like peptidoglycan-associated protein